MYCPTCSEERLGTVMWCVVCGAVLADRPVAEVEAELASVQYLLAQLKRWDTARVPQHAILYLEEHYRRIERVLLSALAHGEPHPSAESALGGRSALSLVPPPDADAAPPVSTPDDNIIMALPVTSPVSSVPVEPAEAAGPAAAARAVTGEDAARDEAGALPVAPGEALFDVPPENTEVQRAVEAASTWSRLWKPFLYESVGWFIGAFLIVAGTFYFVAESWAGMNSLGRLLVLFGVTAGYSAGFSAWGAFFSRKELLAGAGRILGLIGTAIAPFSALALQQVATTQPLLFWPLMAVAGAGAGFLARRPAEAFRMASPRLLQALMAVATVGMGAAPLLARAGTGVLWLNAVPVLLVWRTLGARGQEPRTRESIAFTLLAPAYLIALLGITLHAALVAAGHDPALGTYAPFAAVLLGSALQCRTLDEKRAVDALGVAVVSLQLACVALSPFGQAPAFFVTSAITALTTWTLSRGALPRAPWLYGTYAAGYLTYQSVGQLVPGPLKRLIEQVKVALGYGARGAELPLSYDAIYAVPFVLGIAVLAVRLRRRVKAGAEGSERSGAIVELLLRSTAVASAFFMLVSLASNDHRPALGTIPALVVLCTGLGLWLDRQDLGLVGSAGAVLLPLYALPILGRDATVLLCGAASLAYAGFSPWIKTDAPHGHSVASIVLGLAVAALAWVEPAHSAAGPVALVLAGAASCVLAWDRVSPWRLVWGATLATSAVPLAFLLYAPSYAPAALAVSGVALAILSDRGGRLLPLRVLPFLACTVAAGWQALLQGRAFHGDLPFLLGPVLLGGVASALILARRAPRLGIPGAFFLGAALLLPLDVAPPWHGLGPEASVALCAALGLVSSLWAARRASWPSALAAPWYAAAGLVGGVAIAISSTFLRGGSEAVFLIAAVGAVLSVRALPPSVCFPWASVLSLAALVPHHNAWVLLLAVLLTAGAMLDEAPKVRALLFGARRPGLVGALCALGVAFASGAQKVPDPWEWPRIAAFLVLPLLWVRASRRTFFAAAPGALVAMLVVLGHRGDEPLLWIAALWTVGVTRAVWHAPAAGRLLLGADVEDRVAGLRNFAFATLLPCIAVALAKLEGGEPSLTLAFIALAFLLGAGSPLYPRLIAGALLAALVPFARPVAVGVLLAVALARHHVPALADRVLGADKDDSALPVASIAALGLSVLCCVFPSPPVWALPLVAGVVFTCAFLLSRRWLLAPVPVLLGLSAAPLYVARSHDALTLWTNAFLASTGGLAVAALGAAVLASACRGEGVQRQLDRASRWLGQGFSGGWTVPLWVGAEAALVLPLAMKAAGVAPVSPLSFALLALAAVVLMGASMAWEGALAAASLAAVVALWLPPEWAPVGVASVGVALCLAGHVLEGRLSAARALHESGWVLALFSLLGLGHLGHAATPLCAGLCATAAWIVSVRRRPLEPLAWIASLAALHVAVLYTGVVLSTGKPEAFVLPYVATASALCAAVVLLLPSTAGRRWVGDGFALFALLETVAGLAGIGQQATREAWVGSTGLVLLFVALAVSAVRRRDAVAAYLAQGCLALGYLVVRLHGMGAPSLGGGDSLAALVAGVLVSGLHVWARRQGEGLEVLARPAQVGAFVLPMVGLLAAPWREPLVTAALMVGHAVHFSLLATQGEQRRVGSILAAVAFNGALVLTWMASGAREPQYFIIPAGLSVLVLVRVFRADLSPIVEARLRAVAITAIYAAGAWHPLMFEAGWALLLCVFICVVGVGVGVALRIRSYVYLGTAFMVTSVVANLVRYGVRDHRLGALFLSALGLLVVGFMVLLNVQRAELVRRYERVKGLLEEWKG